MDNKFPDPPKTTGLFHEQNVEIREMRSPTVRRFDLGNNQAGLVVFFVFAAMFVGFGI